MSEEPLATSGGSPRLHHVGLVCPSQEQMEALLQLMGLKVFSTEYVDEYEADCFFAGDKGACIEFIVPRGGKLMRFNKGMGGLHHVAIEVADLDQSANRLQGQGVQLLEEKPVDAGDLLINFVPPAFTRGVIVEFVQAQKRLGEESRD